MYKKLIKCYGNYGNESKERPIEENNTNKRVNSEHLKVTYFLYKSMVLKCISKYVKGVSYIVMFMVLCL